MGAAELPTATDIAKAREAVAGVAIRTPLVRLNVTADAQHQPRGGKDTADAQIYLKLGEPPADRLVQVTRRRRRAGERDRGRRGRRHRDRVGRKHGPRGGVVRQAARRAVHGRRTADRTGLEDRRDGGAWRTGRAGERRSVVGRIRAAPGRRRGRRFHPCVRRRGGDGRQRHDRSRDRRGPAVGDTRPRPVGRRRTDLRDRHRPRLGRARPLGCSRARSRPRLPWPLR